MKAALYLRISQDHAGQSLGVTRQREDCEELAKMLSWDIVGAYVDNDVSATSGKVRPEYRRLLADIERGEVEAVVAWHADRLYRRMRDLEELLDVVRRNRTRIATVKAGEIDLTTDSGQMIAEILASVAGYEGRAKATRWKRAWQQGRENGTYAKTGSRMFGYTREGEMIEDEAEIARSMATDVLNGVPILSIARTLREGNVLTTRGGVWRTGTIRQYLLNPRLAGHSTLKGEVVGEGLWEPILDRDTWETLRALLDARTRPYVPRVSLLNGIIYCGKCKHRLITGKQRDKRTYRCPKRPGMPGCGSVTGNAEPIDEMVETYAKTRLGDPRVRDAVHRLASTTAPAVLADIGNLERRLAELEAQLDEPGVPVATIIRAIDRTKQRLEEAQSQLSVSVPIPIPVNVGDWPTDLERRRRLIDIAVARVELNVATKRIKAFDVERVEITPR